MEQKLVIDIVMLDINQNLRLVTTLQERSEVEIPEDCLDDSPRNHRRASPPLRGADDLKLIG